MVFQRLIYEELSKELDNLQITVLFGARQVGKTFLLKKLAKKRKKSVYLDLEQPDVLRQFDKSDEDIFNYLVSLGDYLFIDEFHYIKNASHIFKAIYDSNHKIKIFASGSSAIEMHKHLEESLAGRTNNFYLKPLSISEFLSKENLNLSTYTKYGGLPRIFNPENDTDAKRQNILNQILSTYIQKDVKGLVKEENIRAFNNLLFMLAENQGQVVSANNLANDLSVSANTVEKYLEILAQTFVIYPLTPFSGNLSNELKKAKKYYFYDFGIRNALLKDFRVLNSRSDKGSIREAYVYYYLLSIQETANTDIHFWRTSSNQEVDFIWRKNRENVAIEVKSKIGKNEIPSGIKSFLKAYPKTRSAAILNEKWNHEIKYKDYTIYFVSFENISDLNEILD